MAGAISHIGDLAFAQLSVFARATLIQQVALTRNPATAAATKTVMGLPAGYWRSIDAVDPIAEANSVDLPMLVLQGARDVQVVDADWQRWRDGFHDYANVTFKLHVDAQLIKDVATWVKAH